MMKHNPTVNLYMFHEMNLDERLWLNETTPLRMLRQYTCHSSHYYVRMTQLIKLIYLLHIWNSWNIYFNRIWMYAFITYIILLMCVMYVDFSAAAAATTWFTRLHVPLAANQIWYTISTKSNLNFIILYTHVGHTVQCAICNVHTGCICMIANQPELHK